MTRVSSPQAISNLDSDLSLLATPPIGRADTTAITDMRANVAEIKKLYSSKTWISPEALPQLEKVATLPGMIYVAAMPDLHPGPGTPGGAAFVSQGLIHPKLIGGDIGCGMQLSLTSLPSTANIRRIADRLGNIDRVWDGDKSELYTKHDLHDTAHSASLGTIGGGNHFAELQVIHSIENAEVANSLGLSLKNVLLLVHSGSRGYGQAVLNKYNSTHAGSPLDPSSSEGLEYITDHDHATRFAKANRELIVNRFAERLGINTTSIIDAPHNFLEKKVVSDEEVWIHRKGAAPADQGIIVIPGSRGSFSYIVRPLGDGEINAYSLAHGAGRKVSRSRCEEKFSHASMSELSRPKDKSLNIDNLVICENKDLLYQEHSKAYKDIAQVIDDMKQLGLLEVVAVLKPILTYKTRAECDDGEG